MQPDSPPRLPEAEALRRRCRLVLGAAIALLPGVAFAATRIGVEAALAGATIVAALLVLWRTSRETLNVLDALEAGHADLLDLEQRWQFALESSGHGVFDWNPLTGQVFRSDAWHRLLGYARSEITDTDGQWRELIHPEDRGIAREFRARLASGAHRSAEVQYRLRHASGQWRSMLSRGSVFSRDAAGRPNRIVGTTTDLTELRAARQQVQDSLDMFRALFDESAYPMVLTTLVDRRISMVNRAASELFGRQPSELVGRTVAELELFSGVERFGDELRSQGRARNFLTQMGERSMLIFGDVLRVRGEDMCLVYGLDVTDRERSVAAERRVHELQRALFEHSPLPMAVLSAEDHSVTDLNQAALDCFGYTREQALGRGSAELRIWAEPGAREEHLEALRAVGHIRGVDRRIRTRLGELRDMQVSAELIESGGERLVLVQFSDVTERRLAERRAARVNEELDARVRERTLELQTTVQELESFSSSVAHDLRAPLRAINAYLQLASDPGIDPAESREYLRKAAGSVSGMAELIDDLLEFARAGRRTLERTLVDMDRLARDVCETLRPLYPSADIVIRPLPPVAGDAILLRQVLHNLVDNALKFSARSAAPRVEICAEEGAQSYVYRVSDNGVGFDMKYAEGIFGVFQRVHDARDFDGTGVGLAIVKRIVERHQGRVWCDSRPGAGATFCLSLTPPDVIPMPAACAEETHGNPAG